MPFQCKPMNSDLVVMTDATFVRPGGVVSLRGVNWAVRGGEVWAVTGPTGSGKTTLVEAVLGLHRVASGRVEWPILDRVREAGRPAEWPGDVIRRVSFREDSRLFSYRGHYYQQRFEFGDEPDVPTVRHFLAAGTGATPAEIETTAARLGVAGLLDLSLMKLSNGQTRRARLARALLAKPELLILDDPFVGLDVAGRADLVELLGGLVREGQHLILVCRPDQMPEWVTNIFDLSPEGWASGVRGTTSKIPPSLNYRPSTLLHTSDPSPPRAEVTDYVSLRHVTVRHGGRTILDDVSWTVRPGERWLLLGPNGSGKTTLLSLLCGDHPQAFAEDVRLFGKRRGTGETIWDVKHNVGLISPEFHLYFTEPLSAARAVATGFSDTLADRPTTAAQDARVRDLLTAVGILPLADRSFATLSTGEQRLVLLARALVKSPPLVILDEPFQGLDLPHIARLRDWLAASLRPDQALIFVTHDENEKPEGVTHTLRLEAGRIR